MAGSPCNCGSVDPSSTSNGRSLRQLVTSLRGKFGDKKSSLTGKANLSGCGLEGTGSLARSSSMRSRSEPVSPNIFQNWTPPRSRLYSHGDDSAMGGMHQHSVGDLTRSEFTTSSDHAYAVPHHGSLESRSSDSPMLPGMQNRFGHNMPPHSRLESCSSDSAMLGMRSRSVGEVAQRGSTSPSDYGYPIPTSNDRGYPTHTYGDRGYPRHHRSSLDSRSDSAMQPFTARSMGISGRSDSLSSFMSPDCSSFTSHRSSVDSSSDGRASEGHSLPDVRQDRRLSLTSLNAYEQCNPVILKQQPALPQSRRQQQPLQQHLQQQQLIQQRYQEKLQEQQEQEIDPQPNPYSVCQ